MNRTRSQYLFIATKSFAYSSFFGILAKASAGGVRASIVHISHFVEPRRICRPFRNREKKKNKNTATPPSTPPSLSSPFLFFFFFFFFLNPPGKNFAVAVHDRR